MKIINIIGSIAIVSVLLWNSGCRKPLGINGNNNVSTETRVLVSFNRIENEGDFNVYYVYDTVFRAVVEAESNLIPYIRTIVNGNTLEIDSRENLSNNYTMKVTVYSPTMVGVGLSGSGLIDMEPTTITGSFDAKLSGSGVIYGSIKSEYFEAVISGSGEINFEVNSTNAKAVISGSGDIQLSGVASNAEYNISGSGNIESFPMLVNECYSKISGSGNIYTTVNDYLNVSISGSGNLYYRGNPDINTSISGSGNVIKD